MTAADVHAYHHTHGLPLNPVYGRLQALGCPEGSQRVGFMVGGGGARMGRYAWLKRGWPADLRPAWSPGQNAYRLRHQATILVVIGRSWPAPTPA